MSLIRELQIKGYDSVYIGTLSIHYFDNYCLNSIYMDEFCSIHFYQPTYILWLDEKNILIRIYCNGKINNEYSKKIIKK